MFKKEFHAIIILVELKNLKPKQNDILYLIPYFHKIIQDSITCMTHLRLNQSVEYLYQF